MILLGWVRAAVVGAVCGAAAGGLALLLDQALVRWLADLTVFVPAYLAVAYPAVGAVLGLSTALVLRWLRGEPAHSAAWRDRIVANFGGAFLGLYVVPGVERVQYVVRNLSVPAETLILWLLVLGVPLGAAAFARWLWRLATPRSDSAGTNAGTKTVSPSTDDADLRHMGWGALLAGGSLAFGLAVNRFVVARPTELKSLSVDAAILLGTLGLAWCYGRLLAGRPLAGLAVIVLVAGCLAASSRFGGDARPIPRGPYDLAENSQPPHLVLLVIDTLRADAFEEVLQSTPEGERLRRALGPSATFRQAVSVAPWTLPTLGTILTGLYPEEHGLVARRDRPNWSSRRFAPGVRSLAEVLQESGYWTEAIGANPILSRATGIDRGFAEYHLLPGPTMQLPLLTALTRVGSVRHEFYQPGGALVDRFERRLDSAVESGRPFFFWLQLMDPHAPLYEHPSLPELNTTEAVPEPAEWTAAERQVQSLYRGEVRYSLDQAARCLERLRAEGVYERTAVVLVSDHGEMLPGDRHWDRRLRGAHGHGHTLHESVVRVPLVIRPAGGLPRSASFTELVSQVDLHDTMLDLVGLGEGNRVGRDRRSLVSFWAADGEGNSRGRRWALLGSPLYGPPQLGLRTPKRKLIHWPHGLPSPRDLAAAGRPAAQRALRDLPPADGDETWQLFHLPRDPDERRDLMQRPEGRGPSAERLQTLYETQRRRLRPAPTDETEADDSAPLDEETRRKLEALGYVG